MMRRAIVLTGCMALSLLPVSTRAGGMMPHPAQQGFQASPEFRQTSALGSPGGFPFRAAQDHRRRVAVRDRRLARPTFFPAFPSFPLTAYPYAPSVPYDTQSPTVNVSPEIYVSPTVYVSVPGAALQPTPVAAQSVGSSLPSVVEYPTGRYELRGDGVGIPYSWVWIPNPPPAPPAPSLSREEAPPAALASAGPSQVYRWTDEQGTEFWTNHLEKVPEPYRSRTGGSSQVAAQQ
jgi:hypothetical protein